MDAQLFAVLAQALGSDVRWQLATDPCQGRVQALQACTAAASACQPLDAALRAHLGGRVGAINARLLHLGDVQEFGHLAAAHLPANHASKP